MQTSLEIKKPNGSEMALPQPTQLVPQAITSWLAKKELIRSTVAKGCSDIEMELFLYTAQKRGLDPLLKQIHAVKRWDSQQQRETMTIQTAIDGFRLVASRTGRLAGIDDAVFEEKDGVPVKATVTLYALDATKTPRPYTATARYTEYVQRKKDGTPNTFWNRMPFTMLGKCAEALALRKAFPEDLSGLYTFEEMGQATNGQELQQAEIQEPTKSMPDERFLELQDWITGSNNDDELKNSYQQACKEADEAGDMEAKRQFNQVKNKRYRELHNAGR